MPQLLSPGVTRRKQSKPSGCSGCSCMHTVIIISMDIIIVPDFAGSGWSLDSKIACMLLHQYRILEAKQGERYYCRASRRLC